MREHRLTTNTAVESQGGEMKVDVEVFAGSQKPDMKEKTIKAIKKQVLLLSLGFSGLLLIQSFQVGKVVAQDTLALEEALQRARKHNFTTRMAEADLKMTKAGVQQSMAAFLPQISVSELATTTNDPLNAFGFKLKQEIVTQADFNPAFLNAPDRIDHMSTRLEFKQPVFNADGFFQHKAARNQAKAAVLGVERTRNYVDFQVKQAYYGLVLARQSLEVVDSALKAAMENRDEATRVFDQGLITRADLLEADVRVLDLNSKRTAAVAGVKNASDGLKYLLGMELAGEIEPTDGLEMRRVEVSVKSGNLDIAGVNAQRSDMQALHLQTQAAKQQLQVSKMQFLPQLNVFGSYELNDNKLFGNHGTNWTVGAMLQWNLFAGLKNVGGVAQQRANLQKSRIAYEDRMLANEMEIEKARRGVVQSLEQLELAQRGIEQARENLRIRTDRYSQGLEKTTDVLNAEVMLANQQLSHLQTLYSYYIHVFQLELLMERPLFQ